MIVALLAFVFSTSSTLIITILLGIAELPGPMDDPAIISNRGFSLLELLSYEFFNSS